MNRAISVIIVEDETITAMFLEMSLRHSGISVHDSVATGESAIASAIKFSPDFVLMDIRLAGKMDGIEAAREIMRQTESQIIFITGHTNGDVMRNAKALNPAAYIVKPFDVHELVNRIRAEFESTEK